MASSTYDIDFIAVSRTQRLAFGEDGLYYKLVGLYDEEGQACSPEKASRAIVKLAADAFAVLDLTKFDPKVVRH